MTNKEGFNAVESEYYISTDFLDENSPAALYVGKDNISIEKRWKWANAYCSFFNTRFIADEKYTLLPNFTKNNVHLKEEFTFGFDNCNITNVEWEFDNGKTGKGISAKYTYQSPGFKLIKVNVTLFGKRLVK